MKNRTKRKYQKRNFALYRMSGMMGNLAHMRYEFRGEERMSLLIEKAMDAIHSIKTFLKESEKEPEIININTAYLLHGPSTENLSPVRKENA